MNPSPQASQPQSGPLQRFTGRRALVTGAAGGIGTAISQRLAAEGAIVAVVDLDLERSARAVEAIVASGGQAEAFACDINISSRAVFGSPGQAAYASAKAGISTLAATLGIELG